MRLENKKDRIPLIGRQTDPFLSARLADGNGEGGWALAAQDFYPFQSAGTADPPSARAEDA